MPYAIMHPDGGVVAVVPDEPTDLPQGWTVVDSARAPALPETEPVALLVPPSERYDDDTLQATVKVLSRQVAALQAELANTDPVKAVADLVGAEKDPEVLRELLAAELSKAEANDLTAGEAVIRSR